MKFRFIFDIADRFFDLLIRLIKTVEGKQRRFQVRLFNMARVFKADVKDFDVLVEVEVVDSEGEVIPGASLPPGFTFTAISDNPSAFDVTQDTPNALTLHCHVGSANPDSSDANARLTATLADPTGAVVATDVEVIVVTVGDPAAVSKFTLRFPDDPTPPTPAV